VSKKKNELTAPDSPEAMLAIIERAQSGDEEVMLRPEAELGTCEDCGQALTDAHLRWLP
jgi:hypothetical protein